MHAGGWNLVRVVLQAGTLIVLARTLNASGYGALAGTVALFMAIGQFTGLGSGTALVRHIARGGEPDGRFVATVSACLTSGLVLFAVALPLSMTLLPDVIPLPALACLAAAEIVAAPSLLPLVHRHLAEEQMFRSSAFGTLAPAARLAAALVVAALGIADITTFAQLYLCILATVSALALFVSWPRKTSTERSVSCRQAIREGLPYAVSGFAMTAGSELDKTVLLRVAGEVITGPYAAAYRIANAATLPVSALVLATSPRLFRGPSEDNHRLAAIMLMAVAAYAVIAATMLWLLAPFAPWLLGQGFISATPLLQALCVVVMTSSLRQYVVALLTTSNRQARRNMIELAGVGLSLLLLAWLVPLFGAYGAIAALAATDLAVIITGAVSIKLNPLPKETDV